MSASLPKCPVCGSENIEGATYCSHCGANLATGSVTPGWLTAVRVLAVLAGVVVACPAGVLGGCFMLSPDSAGLGIALLLVAAAIGGLILWAFKKR